MNIKIINKKWNFTLLLLVVISITNNLSFAENFSKNTSYQTCFTPGENCTDLIVNRILSAKKSIYVQAYSFTSTPIAKAILDAKRSGVDVKVILDKSQIRNNKYSASKFLVNNNIPVFIDHKPAIAHNKVIIIDQTEIITGSFNFTKAAQQKNAENVLIIKDKDLANKYLTYWKIRHSQSKVAKDYMKGNLTFTLRNH